MSAKMKAAFLHQPKDIRVETIDTPEITDPFDVLVRVKAVGICGSDIHFYNRGRIGHFVVTEPLILGHECAGEVVEVGKAVKNVKPGDRVAIEPQVTCRKCEFCKIGKYNLCPYVEFFATPPTHGAFAEHVIAQSDFVFKLPDNVSFEEGALMEPLAVAMQAVKRGVVNTGDYVAVLGVGPIGLLTMQAAKASGATTIYVSDTMDFRLNLAKKLGATEVINAKTEDTVTKIKELTSGRGVDLAFEAAGTITTVRQCMEAVKAGGVVVLVGMLPEDEFSVAVMDIICREYDVRGVFRYCNVFPAAIELVKAGRVDVKPLITHEYPLDKVKEAIEFTDKNKDVAIKVLVKL